MDIREEIFQEFFAKLEGDEGFPSSAVEHLKELLASGQVLTQEGISLALRKGYEDTREN